MNKIELAEKLKEIWSLPNDNQLGDFLGTGRQGIYQWTHGKRQDDISTVIMTKLIQEIEVLRKKYYLSDISNDKLR